MSNRSVLPFFPTPYPDECLYSVFCRYHIRNGAPSVSKTIHDLFGKQASLTPSIVTPYNVCHSKRWYPMESGLSGEKLAYDNTAFQYYLISTWTYRATIFTKMISGEIAMGRSMPIIRKEICSGISHLRYCPACAKEDQKIYGEAYWHCTHQLTGVRYCPVHEERILDCDIPIKKTIYHFYPASVILSSSNNKYKQSSKEDPLKTEYRKLASVVSWLMHNGRLIKTGDHFDIVCARILKDSIHPHFRDERYQGIYLGRRLLYRNMPDPMMSELAPDGINPYYLTPVLKACVIMLLTGDADTFYHQYMSGKIQ